MKSRLAAILAIVLFLVLAGTGVSSALWSTSVTTNATVAAASLVSNCTTGSRLINGSFEDKPTTEGITQADPANMTPWQTTDSLNKIEVWRASAGVPVPVGDQFVELNANSDSTLYQSIATVEGQTIRWSLLHRGRAGTDVMRVTLGGSVNNGVFSGGVSQGTYSADTSGWVRHEGVYTVPAGQSVTLFRMTSVSTGTNNNTIGNFLDDVSFGSGPCLTAGSSVTPATSVDAHVGEQLTYTTSLTNGGGSISLNTVYSTVLPAGVEYVSGSAMIGTALAGTLADYDASTRTLSVRVGLDATATLGGSIAPAQIVVVNFKATVQASAAGTTIGYGAKASYTDYLAPGWPLVATAATVLKNVLNTADLESTVLATPTLVAGSAASAATWSFTIRNTGVLAAATSSVAVGLPAGLTDVGTVVNRSNTNGGAASVQCTPTTGGGATRTCAFGSIPSGESRTITVTRSVTTAQKTQGTAYSVTANATTTTTDSNSANNNVTNTAIVTDITAPAVPTGVALASATLSQANLTWNASTDTGGSGLAGYRVYRNNALVGTTQTASYSDVGLASGTAYSYTIEAFDAAGNVSARSIPFAASTLFDPAAVYRINYPVSATLCLDLENGNNGGFLEIDTCAANTQTFRLTGNVNGYYSVVSNASPTYSWSLTVADANNGTTVTSMTANFGAARAMWSPVPVLDGTTLKYQLVNSLSKSCIDINGRGTTPGTNVQQYECNGSVAQFFTFTKVN